MILSFASPQQMFIFSKQSSHFSQEPRSDSDSQGSVSTDSETSSNKTERTEMAARPNRKPNGCLKGNIWECDRNIIEFRNIIVVLTMNVDRFVGKNSGNICKHIS